MVRLITILVVLVILAIFIALNLPYRTTVDVFGWKLDDAPSVIVIIASVALGIVLSIAVYIVSHLGKRRRNTLRARAADAEGRVRELAEREKDQSGAEKPASAKPEVAAEAARERPAKADRTTGTVEPPTGLRGRLRRFFGR